MSTDTIDQTGACFCKKVKYQIKGEVMGNSNCHCRACSIAHGSPFVHYLIVKNEFFHVTAGEDSIKVYTNHGNLRVARCTDCGTPIYQTPEGATFKATFPRMYDSVDMSVKEPLYSKVGGGLNFMAPNAHWNYENRIMDVSDDLPKFAGFPPNGMVNNDGSPKA